MNDFSVPARSHRSAYNASKRNNKIKFYYLLIAGKGDSIISGNDH